MGARSEGTATATVTVDKVDGPVNVPPQPKYSLPPDLEDVSGGGVAMRTVLGPNTRGVLHLISHLRRLDPQQVDAVAESGSGSRPGPVPGPGRLPSTPLPESSGSASSPRRGWLGTWR